MKYYENGSKSAKSTKEGVKAINEAINVLKSTKPMGSLKWSDDLAYVAKEHCYD